MEAHIRQGARPKVSDSQPSDTGCKRDDGSGAPHVSDQPPSRDKEVHQGRSGTSLPEGSTTMGNISRCTTETSLDMLVVTLTSSGKHQKPMLNELKGDNTRIDNRYDSAGRTLTWSEAIQKWLDFNFRDISTRTYCWPPVFDFKHPGEPTFLIESAGMQDEVPFEKINYDTLKRERKGEVAEEQTLTRFHHMFSEYQIASFFIHGYQWEAQYLKTFLARKKKKKNWFSGGETDILVSLPGRFIMTVEVKATQPGIVEQTNLHSASSSENLAEESSGKPKANLVSGGKSLGNRENQNGEPSPPIVEETQLESAEEFGTIKCGICEKELGMTDHSFARENQNMITKIKSDVRKAFKQCCKTGNFLSDMNIFEEESSIKMIKIASLPKTDRWFVNELFCSACNVNIIAKEDLENVHTLHTWFKRISGKYAGLSGSNYDLATHKRLIGLLIGPASLIKVSSIPESVRMTVSQNKEYGSDARIDRRWCQLNYKQLSIMEADPKLLLLTGVPGSGKSLLGLLKAKQIVQDSLNSVLYIIIDTLSPELSKWYKSELGAELGNMEHSAACEVYVAGPPQLKVRDWEWLPNLLGKLQARHKGKRVHLILDENAWREQRHLIEIRESGRILGTDFEKDWNSIVDKEKVGYIWTLEQFGITATNPERFPLFEIMHLGAIMRMSRQNVDLVNFLSNRGYISGHAVAGKRPLVYRLGCICENNTGEVHCEHCHPVRVLFLLEHAISSLGLTTTDLEGSSVLSTALVWYQDLLQHFHIPLPGEKPASSVFTSVSFCGCEGSIVFLDFDELHCRRLSYGRESLTRSLGLFVFLAGGISDPDRKDIYKKQMTKIDKAGKEGLVSIVDVDVTSKLTRLRRILRDHLSGSDLIKPQTKNEPNKMSTLVKQLDVKHLARKFVVHVKSTVLLEQCQRARNGEGIRLATTNLSKLSGWENTFMLLMKLDRETFKCLQSMGANFLKVKGDPPKWRTVDGQDFERGMETMRDLAKLHIQQTGGDEVNSETREILHRISEDIIPSIISQIPQPIFAKYRDRLEAVKLHIERAYAVF